MKFPASIKVLERGWLSSNNIVFHGPGGSALLDSGYGAHAPQTLALVAHALGGAPLLWLLNTHCHSDHMGGNRALQDRYRCRTSIPEGEAPLVEAWDERALMLGFADQRAERFRIDDTFAVGDALELGGIGWQVIAAPGHDPHSVMLYSPEERLLISADALWEHGFGVIFPQMFGRETAFAETRSTLEAIARLDVRGVIPGHGRPFAEVDAALERAFLRLASYEASVERLARHCLKALLVFSLLERRSLPLAGLPAYLQSVEIFADLNSRYLHMTPEALADTLVADLAKAGAARRENSMLVPLVAA